MKYLVVTSCIAVASGNTGAGTTTDPSATTKDPQIILCNSKESNKGCKSGSRCATALADSVKMQKVYEKIGEHCQRAEVCNESAMGVLFTCSATKVIASIASTIAIAQMI